jgi:sugar/nucleoside kinase (ribokinase family)
MKLNPNSRFDVLGLGASTVDVLSLVDHFPAGEEVQQAHQVTIQGGGPVATALVTLARLGARTAMLDLIGDDWRGQVILNEFEREGVCTDYLRRVENAASATSSILVRRTDGARTIIFAPSTAPPWPAEATPEELMASAKILHVNGRHWEACLQACRQARAGGVKVSFDGGAYRYGSKIKQLIPLVDICIVARDFAAAYTQAANTPQAAAMLLAEGPELVVITDGARGSWIYPQSGPSFHQPAYLLPEVVDTTGCGDSYHGAFLFGLVRGYDLAQSAALASAVAALNTRQLGGRGGLPTLPEVERFIAQR